LAVCKFISSKASVKGALEYITQKEKTEAKLIGGKNCVPENAAEEFEAVKRMFGKSDGRQYYHIIQSFSPNDPVDFETAHELGMQLAAYFPQFQCVVATHKDRKHIHNHIVMNSVSFQNGRMFHQTAAQLEQVKVFVNQLCQQHGFSTTEAKASRRKWPEWKKKLRRLAIYAMLHSYNKAEFIRIMATQGYKVKWEDKYKYITFTTPEGNVCRNNKLFDERLLKENLERYFEQGGCFSLKAKDYQEYRPQPGEAFGGLSRLLDGLFGAPEQHYHQEHIHHSEKELKKMAAQGQKISRCETVTVDDQDEEYEQYHGFNLTM
jgi:hypothetical protein